MKVHFYSHIVETSSISLALADMDLTQDERKHLIDLAQDNLHHAILDVVLSELSEKDKQEFLKLLAQDEHDKIWKLLTKSVDNIEDKIKKTVDELKKELHKDIEESHRRSAK
ncbi:MAG: hypothetical protein HY426_04875 [Candidatus Levybacteria bacterium]|nr:hypothetical protein [Candidatus Levybacteria bacterium]